MREGENSLPTWHAFPPYLEAILSLLSCQIHQTQRDIQVFSMSPDYRKVLLVTAHPDDECMFFTPTITALQQQGSSIHLLCLSSGNADGLGHVRGMELSEACTVLKIGPANLTLIDDPRLQDGLQQTWDAATVASYVAAAVERQQPDLVVTFDSYGVSGHPNHRATYRGVLAFLQQHRHQPGVRRLEVQVLESTPLLRKYLSLLDIPLSALFSHLKEGMVCHVTRKPRRTWQAMKAHRSQLVWFRRLFVFFSRYTYVNTLRRV